MATNSYRGDAQPAAQVDTLVIGGSAGTPGTWIQIACNGKTARYTAVTGDTLLLAAAGLLAAIDAALGGEFDDFGATIPDLVTPDVLLTASKPGVPFTVTVSDSGGALTLATSTTTANKGPENIDDGNNWTLGFPVDGQDLLWDWDAPPARYGGSSLAGVSPASITIRSEVVGLPDRNDLGDYVEYRGKELQVLSCVLVTIESISGATPQVIRVKLVNSSASTIGVNCSGGGNAERSADGPIIRLTSAGAATHTVNILSGSVGLASGLGETMKVSTLRVGTSAFGEGEGSNDEPPYVQIGEGCTLSGTQTPYSGNVDTEATFTTLNMRGDGAAWLQRKNGGSVISCTAGTFIHRSNGNIATSMTFTGQNSVWDASGGVGTFTIPSAANVSFTGGAKPIDPQKRCTFAAIMDRESLLVAEIGDTYTVTRS